MTYLYEDATTTYESFLRGLKVSSKYWLEIPTTPLRDFHKVLFQDRAEMLIPTAQIAASAK